MFQTKVVNAQFHSLSRILLDRRVKLYVFWEVWHFCARVVSPQLCAVVSLIVVAAVYQVHLDCSRWTHDHRGMRLMGGTQNVLVLDWESLILVLDWEEAAVLQHSHLSVAPERASVTPGGPN